MKSPNHRTILPQPTRLGYAFIGLTLLTLIGCINYGLSLGYGLTFLLGSVWLVSAFQVLRSLALWQVRWHYSNRHAQDWQAEVTLSHAGRGGHVVLVADIEQAGKRQTVTLRRHLSEGQTLRAPFSAHVTRGMISIYARELWAIDSLGLWKARRPLHDELHGLVLATPELNPPAPPKTLGNGSAHDQHQRTVGQEDFAGLRPYIEGDSPRVISWKHTARTGTLLSREWDAPAGQQLSLDYALTEGTPEQRFSRLAAWITQAAGQPFSLTLPQYHLPLGNGEAHIRQAQEALANHAPFTPMPVEQTTEQPTPARGKALRHSLWALGWALLGGAGFQPIWVIGLCLGLLAYTGYNAAKEERAEGSLLAGNTHSLMLGGIVATTILLLSTTNGGLLNLESSTAFLAVLIALKATESRTARDAKLLSLLGIFALLTHFLKDQGFLTTLHSLLALGGLLWALEGWVTPSDSAGSDSFKQNKPVKWSSSVPALLGLAAPLAVALFFLFPRMEPLWRLPFQSGNQTGLSNEISAGSLTDLAQSDAVAFRATFEGNTPSNEELYWRGPVYENYDGIKWVQANQRFQAPSLEPLNAPKYHYQLTQEPNGRPWILSLDSPDSDNLPKNTWMTSAFQLIAPRPPTMRTRYDLTSQSARLGTQEDPNRLRLNLYVPQGENPRATALAASWRDLPPEERVQKALALLVNGGFSYTLSPDILPEKDRVDAFLFDSKSGFCEHYASSFGFLMRAAGIPTRLVAGYQGGEEGVGYLTVRQRDAHAWNEVWLEGRGWVRVDPTAVVAPARTTTNVTTALQQPKATTPRPLTPIDRARIRFDGFQNSWNNWVAVYDSEQQRATLGRLGLQVGSISYGLGLGIFVGVLVAGMLIISTRRTRPKDPALASLYDLSDRLGIPKDAGETVTDYTSRAATLFPSQREALSEVARLFNEWRYSANPASDKLLEQLRGKIRNIRRQ